MDVADEEPQTGKGTVRPGALTELLRKVAGAPEGQELPEPALAPGTVIDRFEIVRELDRGGFGVVYEARDQKLDRKVAFKLVRPGKEAGAELLAREAETVARFSHPNLVHLYDVGQSEHGPYLVLELLRGRTLQARLDTGPVPVPEALRVAVEVARGLAHAHAHGVFHRDLKPGNVFLCDDGAVKILDFGMARAFGHRRVDGGTPAYMAPEQWERAPEDERTDVFALGVMLHRMLGGKLPFPDEGRWARAGGAAPRLEVEGLSALGPLVARMLEKSPVKRPRDGAEVLAALEPIERDLGRAESKAGLLARPASFLEELKRRRVFPALLGYALFAFAILQVAEPVVHGLNLPDWALTVVVVALAVGSPVATGLAWVYDLTRHGVVKTGADPWGARGGRMDRARLAAMLAGLGLVAAMPGLAWYLWKPGTKPSAAAEQVAGASIAVLPFDDLSPGHDQDYFSDGIAEEILTALSRVEGLRVPGRASCFWFKGKKVEPAEVGQKLGVAHLLEGSVRRSGNKLRITAEVMKVPGGDRLWSQTFDRELTDVFAVQDEIARAVVEALKLKLLAGQQPTADAPRPQNPEAYNQYLLGRHLYGQFSEDAIRRSVEAYQRAIRIDPSYAPAWAGLSDSLDYYSGQSDTVAGAVELRRQALDAANRAIAQAPDLSEGYSARANLPDVREWAWADVLADARRGVALSPWSSEAHHALGSTQASLGRISEGVQEQEKATNLDPLSARMWNRLGYIAIGGGQYDLARKALRRALEINPEHGYAAANLARLLLLEGKASEALEAAQGSRGEGGHKLQYLAMAHHALGHRREAREAMALLVSRFGHTDAWQVAEAYAWIGDRDQAFAWIERSRIQFDSGLRFFKLSPMIRRLRPDPRYEAVLRSLNLPPDDGEQGK